MKVWKIIIFILALVVFSWVVFNMLKTEVEVIGTKEYIVSDGDTLCSVAKEYCDDNVGTETSEPKYSIKYTPLEVPQKIDSSFKTWMSYKAVTSRQSPQYKLIHTYGWSDGEGFMRASAEKEFGINDDYYLIALGSYYGVEIGTKYRITLDTGKVFYGVLADCKANRHTDATNQYVPVNGNVVEFIVDTTKLNKLVRKMGSANVYPPLNGKVCKIEKMDFVIEL